jgi:hypothetical protein
LLGAIIILSFLFLIFLYYFVPGSTFYYAAPPAGNVYPTSIATEESPSYIAIPTASELNNEYQTNTSWFSGGTLHKSTIKEWRSASYANRLATAADFIAATQNVDYGNMAKFKQMATDLETCISTAAEGGAADNEQTSFISALCLTQLYPK